MVKNKPLLPHINIHFVCFENYQYAFFYNDTIDDVYSLYIRDTYLDGRYNLAILINITFKLLFFRTRTVYVITRNDIKID
jgi:hypothetical protein